MSMNVADSRDLIHGGVICRAGGLGTFWRSRTDFEKKLLIALLVMTLVIFAMTTAVIVLAVQNNEVHQSKGGLLTGESLDPGTAKGEGDTFWQSKTNLEKNLLIALTVMSLAFVVMTIAVIALVVLNNEEHPSDGKGISSADGKPLLSTQMTSPAEASEEDEVENHMKHSPEPDMGISARLGATES